MTDFSNISDEALLTGDEVCEYLDVNRRFLEKEYTGHLPKRVSPEGTTPKWRMGDIREYKEKALATGYLPRKLPTEQDILKMDDDAFVGISACCRYARCERRAWRVGVTKGIYPKPYRMFEDSVPMWKVGEVKQAFRRA